MTRNLFLHVEKAARFCALLISCVLIGAAIALTLKLNLFNNLTYFTYGLIAVLLTVTWVILRGETQTVKRGIIECLAGAAGGTLCLVVLFPNFYAAHDLASWLQCIVLGASCLVVGYFMLISVLSGSAHAVYRLRF